MALLRDTAAELFAMAAIGLVLGLLGPFGSFALPTGPRIAAWMLLALAGYACFRPVIAAGVLMHERSGVPRLAAIALACAVAAVPTTFVVALVFARLRITVDALAASYPYVLLVGALATAIQLALFGRAAPGAIAASPAGAGPGPAPPPAPPAPAPSPEPNPEPAGRRFLDRLPPAMADGLTCLEMEDHYVRAHAPGGSVLVLIRMRDAVAELDGTPGLRVHRSWWVARAAVEGVVRRDRALILRVRGGIEVPVARNAVPELRAAGWL